MDELDIHWKPNDGIDQRALRGAIELLGQYLPDPLACRIDIDAYSEKLWSNAEVAVAMTGGGIVGIGAIYVNNFSTRTAYIPLISVLPAHQSQGVGRRILVELHQLAKRRRMTEIGLRVHKSNTKALAFYERYGFRLHGEIEGKYQCVLNIERSGNI